MNGDGLKNGQNGFTAQLAHLTACSKWAVKRAIKRYVRIDLYSSVFSQSLCTDQVLCRLLFHTVCIVIYLPCICRNGCSDGRSGRETEAGKTARENTQQKHEAVKKETKVKVELQGRTSRSRSFGEKIS